MEEIETAIQQALQTIEAQKQVHILYACESGSRAWGFASQDSDYDVRFIYARPQQDYLRLDVPRDVIEQPITNDLDISGWDIFKALRLLRKSNPPLLEWLFSPIVYLENSPAIAELREIARHLYSSAGLYYHYYHMANGNYRQYLKDKPEIILKKYLYVLRPLVALLFLEQQQQLPPTNFLETLAQVEISEEVRLHIHDLIVHKQAGTEVGMAAPDTVLNAFITEHLDKWNKPPTATQYQTELSQKLEQVLQCILAEG